MSRRPPSATCRHPSVEFGWGPDETSANRQCTVPRGQHARSIPNVLVMANRPGLRRGTRVALTQVAPSSRLRTRLLLLDSLPQAMVLTQPPAGANNSNCWRGFMHNSANVTSTYNHVFLTGAGNGQVIGHPRPPILGLFSNHSLLVEDSVLADNNGMGISGSGTGSYTVRRSVSSRRDRPEFNGNGERSDRGQLVDRASVGRRSDRRRLAPVDGPARPICQVRVVPPTRRRRYRQAARRFRSRNYPSTTTSRLHQHGYAHGTLRNALCSCPATHALRRRLTARSTGTCQLQFRPETAFAPEPAPASGVSTTLVGTPAIWAAAWHHP